MQRKQHRESSKMNDQKNLFQTKAQDKNSETGLKEMHISESSDKRAQIMATKMLTEVRGTVCGQISTKRQKNIRKYEQKLKKN